LVRNWYVEKPYANEKIMRRKWKFSFLFLCQNLSIRRNDLMAKFRFSDEALERIFSKEQMGSVPLKYQSIVVHATEEVIGELGNAYEFQSVGTFEQTDISDT
jgi:hypothetical protein